MLLEWKLILVAILSSIVIATGTFFWGVSVGSTNKEAEIVAEQSKQVDRDNKLVEEIVYQTSKATASAIAEIEVGGEKIEQKIRTEVQERVVYRDCKHSSDSLQQLNKALTNQD